MALTPPPCIEFFVDCSTTERGGSASSTSGGGSSLSDYPSFGYGTTGGSGGTGTSGTGMSSSSLSSASSGLSQRLSSAAERLAQYTVTAANRGTQALKGITLTHGPLPSGAVFDPSRSSKNCAQSGTFVQCTLDLLGGESKDTQIVYKAANSFSCALSQALQTVKLAGAALTGNAATNVSTVVSCTMKTETAGSGSASSSSSLQTGVASGTGTGGTAAYNSSAVAGAIGVQTAGGTGYKPVPMPRTGAADLLFSSGTRDYVLTPVQGRDEGQIMPDITAVLAVVILAAAACTGLRRVFA
jgi:hypothetical protein